LSGHAFAQVDPTEFVGQRTDENDFQLALSSSQNLTCVKFEDLLYVAKKPKRLVTKKNKLVTALAKIFAVSKTSQTRDVFEGVSKSRYLHEKIPFDVFHEFLSRLDFFQLDEGMIQCNTPPAVSALTKGEMIIAQMAREADGILNSTNVHQTLIKNGIPSTSARQVVIHTPLLISLRRGAYRQEGLYKFVGNMDAVLQTDRGSKGADPDDFIVTIADDAKTRMFGRVTMTEKISIEGIVEVYDREENFICSVNIKGLTLTGLQPLLIGNQNRAITLIYDGSTKCFVVN
jgi:hypothetical protein